MEGITDMTYIAGSTIGCQWPVPHVGSCMRLPHNQNTVLSMHEIFWQWTRKSQYQDLAQQPLSVHVYTHTCTSCHILERHLTVFFGYCSISEVRYLRTLVSIRRNIELNTFFKKSFTTSHSKPTTVHEESTYLRNEISVGVCISV